jgi:hypothetical protein
MIWYCCLIESTTLSNSSIVLNPWFSRFAIICFDGMIPQHTNWQKGILLPAECQTLSFKVKVIPWYPLVSITLTVHAPAPNAPSLAASAACPDLVFLK